jgi:dolichol-phosphate mannosyltransferase
VRDWESGEGALICVPTYDERENIELIVPAIFGVLPKAHVLVIDDASPDGTGEIADRIARADPRVHVLHRAGKEGLGKAYLDGFRWAIDRRYEEIFECDADFSHDPKYLATFMRILQDADVVVGSRRVPGGGVVDWGPIRRLVSWGGSMYAMSILGVGVRDLTGGFNGFRRRVLETIGLDGFETTGYGFQIEVKFRAIRAGFKLVETPIVFPDRVRGKSKMSPSIMGEAAINVIRLRLGL